MSDGTKKILLIGVLGAIAYAELGPIGLIVLGVVMMIL